MLRIAIIGERAWKQKGSGDVVIGDDQMVRPQFHIAALVDVIVDRPKLRHDAFIGPAFERAAEVDADQLAEYAGIDAFGVIMWNRRQHNLP